MFNLDEIKENLKSNLPIFIECFETGFHVDNGMNVDVWMMLAQYFALPFDCFGGDKVTAAARFGHSSEIDDFVTLDAT